MYFLVFIFIALFAFPLFLGELPGNNYIPAQKIDPLLYVFFSFSLFTTVLISFFYSLKIKPALNIYSKKHPIHVVNGLDDKIFFYILITLFVIVLAVYFSSQTGVVVSKSDVLKSAGFKLVLLETIAIILVVYSFIRMNKYYVYLSYICVLVVFFLFGVRSVIVISSLALIFFKLNSKNSITIPQIMLLFIGTLFALFLIIILKPIYGYLLGDKSDLLFFISKVISEGGLISGVEFLMTQHIFNAVVISDFMVSWWEVPISLLCISPIPTEFFGFSSSIFNDFFQPALYSHVPYGMAYNPWAEAYSWGGCLGLFIYLYIVMFNITLLQSYIDKKPSAPFLPLIIIISIFTVFYFHRNSIGSYLAYLRNYLYLYLFVWIAVRVCKQFLTKKGYSHERK